MRDLSIITKTISEVVMRLKELREEEGKKQAYIAKLLNIKQNTYSQYETGQRQIPIELLKQLALYYHVSVDYILELTDVYEPYPRKKTEKNESHCN